MPTNLKKEPKTQDNEDGFNTIPVENEQKEMSIFKNKELNIIKDEKDEEILFNITEKIVLTKLDATLKKMSCCRCDRCKQDIIAITLNNLKPMYVVSTKDEIEQKIDSMKELGIQVTREVIRAILTVRKEPRH